MHLKDEWQAEVRRGFMHHERQIKIGWLVMMMRRKMRMEMRMSIGLAMGMHLACHGGPVATLSEASGRMAGRWIPRNQILLAGYLVLPGPAVFI